MLAPTLRGRLVLAFVAVVIAVVAVLGAYLVVAARTLYVERLSGQLAAQARLVGAAVAPTLDAGGGIAAVDPLVKRLGTGGTARLTVLAANGTVLGDSLAKPPTMQNHNDRPEVIAARRFGVGSARRHSATLGKNFLYVAVPIRGAPGAIARVALPLDEVDAAVWRIQRDLVVAAVLAAVLAAAVAAGVATRITGPVEDLRRQARAVAAGRLDVAVAPATVRELGELGRTFNAMTTRLRALVAESAQSRVRLEAMLANLSDGVVITDATGRIVRVNEAAARMFGTTGEEAVGQTFVVVARDHDLAALLRDSLVAGAARSATVEHGPGQRVLEAAARPLIGGDERLGLVVVRDVTELRRLERVRREFVANVSHELRTPLTSIRALAETLGDGAMGDPEVAAAFLRQIIDESDRLAALVEELLDLGRLESGRIALNLEELDPVSLIARGIERLRPQTERAGLTLRVAAPPGLPRVRADRARVEQVLLNLVHNAIKFTPAGGTITVAAATRGDMLEIAVRDTGIGIPAAELPRVFERFYKADKARHSPGTGLGLAIAKHIVQAHGGTIRATSAPPRGATFAFTLPLAKASEEATQAAPVDPAPAPSTPPPT